MKLILWTIALLFLLPTCGWSQRQCKRYGWKDQSDPKVKAKKDSPDEVRCRLLYRLSPEKESKLKCLLKPMHQKDPALTLFPVKVEQLFLDPEVLLFHDVISEAEIREIVDVSRPRLKRSVVVTPSGNMEAADYRISSGVWYNESEHALVRTLNQRVHLLTGLAVNTAEDLQVVQYEVGGHYASHFDFTIGSGEYSFGEIETGNRIATWMFYLSDVREGGETLFPDLGIRIKPVKGAAVFWYNLHTDGSGDMRTLHAGCPVIAGSKWIANKWLHEHGQEFRRPCLLFPVSSA